MNVIKAKILIVDDEPDFLDTCARLLTRLGFHCVTAENAPDAVDLIKGERPDLVITDLNLPIGDGFQVARCSRTRLPAIPVIIITAYHTSEIAKKARGVGAASYLTKPFSNHDLTEAVRDALTHSSTGSPT